MKCEDCMWWEPDQVLKTGSCHRYPPKIQPLSFHEESGEWRVNTDSRFPETLWDDWCGEFKQDPIEAKP